MNEKKELMLLRGIDFSRADQPLLAKFNMVLYEQETVFLIGPPECGKKYLAKIIAGMEMPEQGEMYFKGGIYNPKSKKKAEKHGVYFVHSEVPFMKNMTICENIGLVRPQASVHPFYRQNMHSMIGVVCEEYGIPLQLGKMADRLSPLDIIYIHLARAILLKTKLLILSDLLYLLREKHVKQVFNTVLKMKENGITLMFLESTAQYAEKYSDRTIFMNKGMILADKRKEDYSVEEESILIAGMLEHGHMEQIAEKKMDEEERIRRCCFYHSPWGRKKITVYSGECLGITCENSDFLLWYMEKSFTREMIWNENKDMVSILSLNNLQKDCFYFMKFDDNLILPVLKRISFHGILFPNRHIRFLNSEFAGTSFVKKNLWKKDLYTLNKTERMTSVLYRVLIEGTDVIVLTGHLEQISGHMLDELKHMIEMAKKFHKSVILYAKNCEIMRELCDEIKYLDE